MTARLGANGAKEEMGLDLPDPCPGAAGQGWERGGHGSEPETANAAPGSKLEADGGGHEAEDEDGKSQKGGLAAAQV